MSQVAAAFYIPHSWRTLQGVTGHAIAWATAGKEKRFSHAEVVAPSLLTGDLWCLSSSAMDGGWRAKRAGVGENQIDLTQGHWVLVTRPDIDPADVWEVFNDHAGIPYGWLDLFGHFVPGWPDSRGGGGIFAFTSMAFFLSETFSRLLEVVRRL